MFTLFLKTLIVLFSVPSSRSMISSLKPLPSSLADGNLSLLNKITWYYSTYMRVLTFVVAEGIFIRMSSLMNVNIVLDTITLL